MRLKQDGVMWELNMRRNVKHATMLADHIADDVSHQSQFDYFDMLSC